MELDYPILSDPQRKVATSFGVVTESRRVPFRWTFFIDPQGKLVHIDKKVDTQTHGTDVVAKLKELGIAD